jgi:tetratricopeptide (TPR) repeat protein
LEAHQPEHLINLPLVSKDEENTYLPLVINVLTKYWGEDFASYDTTNPLPSKATLIIEGIEFIEKHGFVCYIYKGTIKDIKKRIDQAIPPIVILPGIRDSLQHAMIVSGYNIEERRILMYVPEPETIGAVPEDKFEEDWQQDDMNTLVIIPSDMKNLFDKENLKFAESNRICLEAEMLRQKGAIENAISKLKRATEIDPDNAQVWCILGGIYNEIGAMDATTCYENAIKLNAKYYLAYRGLGNYYLKKKDYALAESYYSKAISINPIRFGPIFKNRAVARIELGNNEGAKQDLQEYLAQVPNAPDKQSIDQALTQL